MMSNEKPRRHCLIYIEWPLFLKKSDEWVILDDCQLLCPDFWSRQMSWRQPWRHFRFNSRGYLQVTDNLYLFVMLLPCCQLRFTSSRLLSTVQIYLARYFIYKHVLMSMTIMWNLSEYLIRTKSKYSHMIY